MYMNFTEVLVHYSSVSSVFGFMVFQYKSHNAISFFFHTGLRIEGNFQNTFLGLKNRNYRRRHQISPLGNQFSRYDPSQKLVLTP